MSTDYHVVCNTCNTVMDNDMGYNGRRSFSLVNMVSTLTFMYDHHFSCFCPEFSITAAEFIWDSKWKTDSNKYLKDAEELFKYLGLKENYRDTRDLEKEHLNERVD